MWKAGIVEAAEASGTVGKAETVEATGVSGTAGKIETVEAAGVFGTAGKAETVEAAEATGTVWKAETVEAAEGTGTAVEAGIVEAAEASGTVGKAESVEPFDAAPTSGIPESVPYINQQIKEILPELISLRKRLHATPELSGQEKRTKEVLMEFISSRTSLSIVDCGNWFYAVHREAGATASIAFRADMDAIKGTTGEAFHGCGHDGHSSVLAGLCLMAEGRKFGRDIYFIFQHAEETGEGGAECSRLLEGKKIGRVYGFHNLPGYPEGAVVLRRGVFSCASKGLVIEVRGKQCHAAYPEQGINPAYLISRLVGKIPEFLNPAGYRGMVLATIVEVRVGEEAFGVSAGEGRLALTIRAERQEDLDELQRRILDYAGKEAAESGCRCSFDIRDEFPDTVNSVEIVDRARNLFEQCGLRCVEAEAPMRWSEDFGWYLRKTEGMYFGIGAGTDWPGLHTPDFEFCDTVMENAILSFCLLMSQKAVEKGRFAWQ